MSVAEVVVRPAVDADLKDVTEIFAHYATHTVITFEETPPTVEDWRRRLGDLAGRGLPFLVADLSGQVAGYTYAAPWSTKPAYRHTVEDSIYLAPGQTGRGLGGALLGALLGRCAEAGLRQVIGVIADTGNDASAALHRRFGFTHAGLLTGVGYKHGRSIDTTLMQRTLTSGDSGR